MFHNEFQQSKSCCKLESVCIHRKNHMYGQSLTSWSLQLRLAQYGQQNGNGFVQRCNWQIHFPNQGLVSETWTAWLCLWKWHFPYAPWIFHARGTWPVQRKCLKPHDILLWECPNFLDNEGQCGSCWLPSKCIPWTASLWHLLSMIGMHLQQPRLLKCRKWHRSGNSSAGHFWKPGKKSWDCAKHLIRKQSRSRVFAPVQKHHGHQGLIRERIDVAQVGPISTGARADEWRANELALSSYGKREFLCSKVSPQKWDTSDRIGTASQVLTKVKSSEFWSNNHKVVKHVTHLKVTPA